MSVAWVPARRIHRSSLTVSAEVALSKVVLTVEEVTGDLAEEVIITYY